MQKKILKAIDLEDLMARFEDWTCFNNVEQEDSIAIDGKVLRSTVKHPNNALQNFVVQVSAYDQTSGLVYKVKSIQSKLSKEARTARTITEELAKTGAFFYTRCASCSPKY